MEKHLKIQDTCGIHNLHAMPGVVGGIVGAITAASASIEVYGHEGWVFLAYKKETFSQTLWLCFPFQINGLKRKKQLQYLYSFHWAPLPFFKKRLVNTFDFEDKFKDMVPTTQGGHQAAGLCVALCFGIGGGIIVGKEISLTEYIHLLKTAFQTVMIMT